MENECATRKVIAVSAWRKYAYHEHGVAAGIECRKAEHHGLAVAGGDAPCGLLPGGYIVIILLCV